MTESRVPVVRQQPQAPSLEVLTEVVNGLNRKDRHDQLLALLGSEKAVQRFITVSLHYLSGASELLERCSPASIVEAVREAATLDLEPTGILGEAWIVRHGNRAVLRVGWRGFLKLLRRSGQIVAADVQIVYENDQFELELGTNPYIKHTPDLNDRGTQFRGAYAWARMPTGEFIIEWMTTADIEAVRAVSQAKNAMAWTQWWSEMARKSVVRRLVKRLPLSPVAEKAVALDEVADNVEGEQPDNPVRAKTLELLARATGGDIPPEGSTDGDYNEAEAAAVAAAIQEELSGTGSK